MKTGPHLVFNSPLNSLAFTISFPPGFPVDESSDSDDSIGICPAWLAARGKPTRDELSYDQAIYDLESESSA